MTCLRLTAGGGLVAHMQDNVWTLLPLNSALLLPNILESRDPFLPFPISVKSVFIPHGMVTSTPPYTRREYIFLFS